MGSIPWTALVFFTLYLQLLGMSDFAASVLMSTFLGSTGVQSNNIQDMFSKKLSQNLSRQLFSRA